MGEMVLWVVAAIAATGGAGILGWWLGSRRERSARDAAMESLRKAESDATVARAAQASAASELAQHRDALKLAQSSAARLPDALSRAERAEAEAMELRSVKDGLLADRARLDGTLQASREDAAKLAKQVDLVTSDRDDLRSQLINAQSDLTSTTTLLASTNAEVARLTAANEKLGRDLQQARENALTLTEARSHLQAHLDAARARLKESEAFLTNAQQQLRSAFLEAASKVFDEKSVSLERRIEASGNQSKDKLEESLKPFAARMGELQSRIESLSTEHAKDFAQFQGSVGHLRELNQKMADATNALARALKGNAKARGDWGETILEKVLELAGLIPGMHYDRQASLIDDDSGDRLIPDIVVKLPNDHRIAVDSKVNLIAWSDFCNAETPEASQEAIQRHVIALRSHVRDLASKNYPKAIGSTALEVTVLFVPIEGALSSALAEVPNLQFEAMNQRIVFASPNTLMAMLSVIGRLWQRDKLQRQVSLIADEGGKLLEALNAFLPEFDAIQKHLARSDEAFKDARRRLYESDQSVVSRAQRLVQAGVRPRKGKALLESLEPVQEALPALPAVVEGEGADPAATSVS